MELDDVLELLNNSIVDYCHNHFDVPTNVAYKDGFLAGFNAAAVVLKKNEIARAISECERMLDTEDISILNREAQMWHIQNILSCYELNGSERAEVLSRVFDRD